MTMLTINIPSEQKKILQIEAIKNNMSMKDFILEAVDEKIKHINSVSRATEETIRQYSKTLDKLATL